MASSGSKIIYYEADYVQEAVIKATDYSPEIHLSFKPLNIIQASNLTDAVLDGKSVLGAAQATLEMLSEHLVKWDVVKSDGSAVNCNLVEELNKINSNVINKVASIVRQDDSTPEQDQKVVTAVKNLSREQDST